MNPKSIRSVLQDDYNPVYTRVQKVDIALSQIAEIVDKMSHTAIEYVKDERSRLLSVGYNQALSDVISKIKEG